MKPTAVLLVVSLAAALGACGDEAGAPPGEPAAPRSEGAAALEAPPQAPTAPTTEPAVEATPSASAPAAAAQAPEAPSSTPAPAAVSPSAAPPAASATVATPPAPSATPAPSAQASSATGTVLRADKLYSEPASTSNAIASVAKGASVDILAKQGGWLRVKAGGQSGWIRLLSVRAGSGGLGGAGVGDVIGAATTRSDPSRIVAVAGLRGLNDEDLKQAKFNAEELARMEARNVSPTQAADFANQSGLAQLSVADLPKPQPR